MSEETLYLDPYQPAQIARRVASMGGVEVFTSNNLLAMAWASQLLSTRQVLRNWLLVAGVYWLAYLRGTA
ncbi:MAG: hypothetical protein JSW48_02045 [Betaproteobacteria bacterium]|jgi:hypothetical protein|nr:MAG: hypothetical protein JSW48_02045 [Betaproteobacteria bacterium]